MVKRFLHHWINWAHLFLKILNPGKEKQFIDIRTQVIMIIKIDAVIITIMTISVHFYKKI